MKTYIIFIISILCIFAGGCAKQPEKMIEETSFEQETTPAVNEKEVSEETQGNTNAEEMSTEIKEVSKEPNGEIKVYVCGAVKNPGLVSLTSDARIWDAIEAAGGFTKAADKEYLNQAQPVADGQKVQVYTKKETADADFQTSQGKDTESITQEQSHAQDGKVDLNSADKTALMTIPGVGEAKAELILKYRETNGRFHVIEDIMQIEGIKEGTFQKLKEHIKVE